MKSSLMNILFTYVDHNNQNNSTQFVLITYTQIGDNRRILWLLLQPQITGIYSKPYSK